MTDMVDITSIRDKLGLCRSNVHYEQRTIDTLGGMITDLGGPRSVPSSAPFIPQQMALSYTTRLWQLKDCANGQDLIACGALKIILAYEFPFLGPQAQLYCNIDNEAPSEVASQVQQIATTVEMLIASIEMKTRSLSKKLQEISDDIENVIEPHGQVIGRIPTYLLQDQDTEDNPADAVYGITFTRMRAEQRRRETSTYTETQELERLRHMANKTTNINAPGGYFRKHRGWPGYACC